MRSKTLQKHLTRIKEVLKLKEVFGMILKNNNPVAKTLRQRSVTNKRIGLVHFVVLSLQVNLSIMIVVF